MPVQTRSRPRPAALSLALGLALAGSPALAVDYFWDPTAGSTSWSSVSSWQLAGGQPASSLPSSSNRVFIRRDNSDVWIGDIFGIHNNASSADIIVGGLADRSATLRIVNEGTTLTTHGDAYVGLVGEGLVFAAAPQPGPTWTISGNLWLGGYIDDVGGASRVGTVRVQQPNTTVSATNLFIGASHNASGTLTMESSPMTGASSGTVNISQAVVVGARRDLLPTPTSGGTGSIFMTGAAKLNSGSGILGEHLNSTGTVTVGGVDTRWSITDTLQVGRGGTGELSVIGSGMVLSSGGTVLGVDAGSSGTVSVFGSGRFQNNASLVVGEFGDGVLELASGGSVNVGGALNNGSLQLASGPGSSGVLRQGTGATPGVLDVGLIFGGLGGTVEFNHNDAAYDLANSFGQPVSIGGALSIEHLGSGTTRIFTDSIYGGSASVRQGTLDVDGVQIGGPASDLIIGRADGDAGNVVLRNGARSLSPLGDLRLAITHPGASGSLEMSGAGTQLQSQSVSIAERGDAEVQLTAGATVSTGSTVLGSVIGASGTLNLAGSGTRWDISGSTLHIGAEGSGTVNLRGGATLSLAGAPRRAILAFSSSGSGVLNIGTGGATGTLDVGEVRGGAFGEAVLNFNHTNGNYRFMDAGSNPIAIQGAVQINHLGSGLTRIARMNNLNSSGGRITVRAGTLQLEGAGVLAHSNAETVAGDVAGDNGTIELLDSSTLMSSTGRIGRVPGSTGTVRVNGPSAKWLGMNNLFVGGNGSGSLSVLAGGEAVAQNIMVGRASGASGSAVVAGQGSHLVSFGPVVIGNEGSGSIIVRGGGRLSAGANPGTDTVTLADKAGSSGSLAIGNGAQPGVLNASAVVGGAGSATLSFNHEASDFDFENTAGFPVSVLGSTQLHHVGSGTTRLSGVLGYTGDTLVSAGVLILNGQVASSDVLVTDQGTLAGNATLTNAGLVIDEGGTLMPGDGVGTMQAYSLTIDPAAFLVFELSTPGVAGGGVNDYVQVGVGDLSLAGELHVLDLPGFGPGRYPLIGYGGNLVTAALSIGSLPPGFDPGEASIDYSVVGEVALIVGSDSSDQIFSDRFE